jgi:hypothetical protein
LKGQSTIEFLAGIVMFLIVITASLSVLSERVPQFTDDVEQSSKNLEMYRITSQLLQHSGRHSFGSGGQNWEKNESTTSNTEEIGLASDYRSLEYDKIQRLSTAGSDRLNYSQFRNIVNVEHQYFFNFTWFPVVETSASFTRTQPPSSPNIIEPNSNGLNYDQAENRVHYGNMEFFGTDYKFLVVAFDGTYNTTYISKDYDFREVSRVGFKGVGDVVNLDGREYTVEEIQNRDRKPGSSVILSHHLKSFGPSPQNTRSDVTKLNRYAVMETASTDPEILRMEVLSW